MSTSVKKNSLWRQYLKPWLAKNYLILIFLTLLVFLAYVNSLGGEFISDDVEGIVKNQMIGSARSFLSQPLSFIQPFLYFILYHLGARAPVWYRLLNLGAHLGVVLILFALLSAMGVKRAVAVMTAALFAVHPIGTESVSWISGLMYVIYGLLFLLSFTTYILAKKDKRFYVLSLVFFLLALVASDKSASLPLVFLLYEYTQSQNLKNYKKFLPYFIIAGVFVALRVVGIGLRLQDVHALSPFANEIAGAIYNYNPWLQIPIAVSTYLALIAWPSKLTLYHAELINYGHLWYYISGLLLLLIAIIYSFFKNKIIFFWLSFFLISLGVTLAPLGIASSVAERYVYLGSIGIFFVVAYGIDYLGRLSKNDAVTIVLCSILIIAYGVRTITRNIEWSTFDNFWTRTVQTSPLSFQARNNVGNIYMKQQKYPQAIREYKAALTLVPSRYEISYNLGIAYLSTGQYPQAIEAFEKSLVSNPQLFLPYQGIAIAKFEMKDYTGAQQYMQKAITLRPTEPGLYVNLGAIFLKQNDVEEAKKHFQTALLMDPQNQKAQEYLQKIASGEIPDELK